MASQAFLSWLPCSFSWLGSAMPLSRSGLVVQDHGRADLVFAGLRLRCAGPDLNVYLSGNLCDSYVVTVRNAGSEPTDGSPMVFTDTLPEGVTLEARYELQKDRW